MTSWLTQTEYDYDGDGNIVLARKRDRFSDAVGTGALGMPARFPQTFTTVVSGAGSLSGTYTLTQVPGSLEWQATSAPAGVTDDVLDNNGDGIISWSEGPTNYHLTINGDGSLSLTPSASITSSSTFLPQARVSYMAYYYDAADRLITSVNHGTNGGFAYTRPDDAPGRDTMTGTSSTSGTTTTLIDSSRMESGNYFEGYTLNITGGTGSGQTATVTGYDSSTHTFTLGPALATAPDNTSTYSLVPNALVTTYAYETNEIQSIAVYGSPTGGTFTLTLDGDTTSSIAYNASVATVQSDLEALANVGSGNVSVTQDPSSGVYVVEFTGDLANADMPQLTATSLLTGGTSPGMRINTAVDGRSGELVQTTDPRGIVSLTSYDALGRTTRTLAAFTDGRRATPTIRSRNTLMMVRGMR